MVTKDLFKKIMERIGETSEGRQVIIQKRMNELNQRLNEQFESQRMMPEILNKRCTL